MVPLIGRNSGQGQRHEQRDMVEVSRETNLFLNRDLCYPLHHLSLFLVSKYWIVVFFYV